MTEAEIAEVLEGVRYKDWTFRLYDLNVTYDPDRYGINGNSILALQIEFVAKSPFNGLWERQYSRKWILEPKDESELLRTVWLAVMTAEEHEARELFTYNGKRIFGPHKNQVGSAQRTNANTASATT